MLSGFSDVHVRRDIVEGLRRRQMDILTAREAGMLQTPDDALLDHALTLRRVMLTNDTDFLAIGGQRQQQGVVFAPIFFWPQAGRSVGECIRRIVSAATQMDYDDSLSTITYL
jgi:hypothetical protein